MRLEPLGGPGGEELPERTWQEGGRLAAQVCAPDNALYAFSKQDNRSYFILMFTDVIILLL